MTKSIAPRIAAVLLALATFQGIWAATIVTPAAPVTTTTAAAAR